MELRFRALLTEDDAKVTFHGRVRLAEWAIRVGTSTENDFSPHRSQADLTLLVEGGAANSCNPSPYRSLVSERSWPDRESSY